MECRNADHCDGFACQPNGTCSVSAQCRRFETEAFCQEGAQDDGTAFCEVHVFAGGNGRVRLGDIELNTNNGSGDIKEGDAVTVCIRPEDVATRGITPGTANTVPALIETLEFLGSFYRATLQAQDVDKTEIRADFSINLVRDLDINEGREFTIALPPDQIRVYGETFTHADDLI